MRVWPVLGVYLHLKVDGAAWIERSGISNGVSNTRKAGVVYLPVEEFSDKEKLGTYNAAPEALTPP